MKKLAPTIALIICSIWITSCSNSQTDTAKETSTKTQSQPQTSTNTQSKTVATKKPSNSKANTDKTQTSATGQPKIGTVKEVVNGDLKCYVTLVDEKGIKHNLGATFEVCEKPETLLNKKVSLDYKIESVSDCQSAEPCGKTKKESLISKMEIQK
ncbi:MAG: hypothetical protein RMX68_020560 [Aulosira sp. ZfuVER01]|nr:hypothetical protein [Aulosira sp. ZfuVER01]MDZ8002517.1 hypothetical protein [Aulosira sp. DedVER01a]MDZ8050805.1 hypothetical protein [Aulosira sp. ZfuCHP01]